MCGYDGPVYMTYPTKAICPILLEDYRKISVERKGVSESNFYTSQMIKNAMKKGASYCISDGVTDWLISF